MVVLGGEAVSYERGTPVVAVLVGVQVSLRTLSTIQWCPYDIDVTRTLRVTCGQLIRLLSVPNIYMLQVRAENSGGPDRGTPVLLKDERVHQASMKYFLRPDCKHASECFHVQCYTARIRKRPHP